MNGTRIACASLILFAHASIAQDIVDVSPGEVARLLERPTTLRVVPGEIIVKFRTGEAPMGAAAARSLGLRDVTRVTSGGEVIYNLSREAIGPRSVEDTRELTIATARDLAARADVEYAQPNYIVQIMREPNDPFFPLQWHYRDNGTAGDRSPGGVNLPSTWDLNTGDAGVVVAVIDTGILPNHPDIAGSPNLVPGFDMISDAFIANDGDGRDADPTDPGDASAAGECFPGSPPSDDSWHGSHVAGTVGVGNTDNGTGVAGVNWNVSLQAVRVLGKCGGTIADINDAIRWAAGLPVPGAPANQSPARVINMSLGGRGACTNSPATQAAIDDAVGAGATVVVAAGNDAQDASGFLPASCDGVITVAASDARGHLVSRYSNFGADVEIMAPGGDVRRDDDGDGNVDGVLSTVQGGYAFYNGTSMASPHVAGVAALLLARFPSLTPAEVADRLQSNAIPRDPNQCPRPCGAGLLDARVALGAPQPPPPPPQAPELELAPSRVSLGEGATATLTATLTRGGAPMAGETVSFASANVAVASVSPSAASTGADGTAQTTVRGVAAGSTSVSASAAGETATSNVQVTATDVPDLGTWGLVALALALLLVFHARARAARR